MSSLYSCASLSPGITPAAVASPTAATNAVGHANNATRSSATARLLLPAAASGSLNLTAYTVAIANVGMRSKGLYYFGPIAYTLSWGAAGAPPAMAVPTPPSSAAAVKSAGVATQQASWWVTRALALVSSAVMMAVPL